ncbi:MAG: adenosine-specific kinase [Bacillota bacterium]
MEIKLCGVPVKKPEEMNVILGTSHFIKTMEDIPEAIANAGGGIRYGLAFCEGSGPRLIRTEGNDESLVKLAVSCAEDVAAGHFFALFIEDGFPVNVLNNIKLTPEVCTVHCATANPVTVIVAETEQGRAVLGTVDGGSPLGVENEEDVQNRRDLLRNLGYKF